jgi:hypothetical protein
LTCDREVPAERVDAVPETGQTTAGDDGRVAAAIVVDEHDGLVVFATDRNSEI